MINISDETVHSCFMLKLLTNLVVLCDFLENHRVKITNKINLGGAQLSLRSRSILARSVRNISIFDFCSFSKYHAHHTHHYHVHHCFSFKRDQ
jgi:hypothetical protein